MKVIPRFRSRTMRIQLFIDLLLHIISLIVVRLYFVLKVRNKSVPIFARKLRKFFTKKFFFFFFFFIANLDSASKVGSWFPRTPHPHWTWEFWILANLDSASKVGNWFPRNTPRPPLPPPHQTWEFWISANLNSASKVGNWFPQTPPPPPTPPPDMGILDFSKFELSIKSRKLVSTNPFPPNW